MNAVYGRQTYALMAINYSTYLHLLLKNYIFLISSITMHRFKHFGRLLIKKTCKKVIKLAHYTCTLSIITCSAAVLIYIHNPDDFQYRRQKTLFITGTTRNSAIADKPRDAFRGQSRSPNMVPFHVLGMVSC